ncbi:HPt (histidine-containing phosphotransfer) domain-containing protein [Methylorubrum rhodinum]|jgi:HPt (histidine-containing phosphotransfer) domain-containing protein|uniref:HPt (Histidine-containing phosphotransfer) domain-containing protein n=1 Tax=Methylorubrum rhodinum TaxID=29428 RepID=A0A840ZEM1_9HYPH|nr:Hpt domain-containing protein [Methylorubrum rhodinum]MBB5755491.1 HPt (histidine-containing phosphotransfer) domain-containing protein [Methylorubrum rhodinum]
MTALETAPEFDAEVMAELEDLFGRPRLLELLGALDQEIAARLDPPSGDRAQLARDAHVLVSSSGALAFSSLSQACARLEHACLREADVEDALSDVLADAARARTAIAVLRAA